MIYYFYGAIIGFAALSVHHATSNAPAGMPKIGIKTVRKEGHRADIGTAPVAPVQVDVPELPEGIRH